MATEYCVFEDHNGEWEGFYTDLGGDWHWVRSMFRTKNYDSAINFADELTKKNGKDHKVFKRTISPWKEV